RSERRRLSAPWERQQAQDRSIGRAHHHDGSRAGRRAKCLHLPSGQERLMFQGIKSAWRRAVKSAAFSFDTISAGWYARNGYYGIYNALSEGLPAWSGEPVSMDTALGLSTVWACNKIISESVGFLPLNMMREKGNTKELAIGHPLFSALKHAPNVEMTTQNFTELLTSHGVMQ